MDGPEVHCLAFANVDFNFPTYQLPTQLVQIAIEVFHDFIGRTDAHDGSVIGEQTETGLTVPGAAKVVNVDIEHFWSNFGSLNYSSVNCAF
ncbi:hypothetical protein AVEN_74463-1 [Araneus ventricosus]|uniref:Uncharacterized protein n=1 Tax=Araneus ventricosus TaxID=182803 RepID=A0A4Y2TYL1_ARAVE|nr:hypothetical protein AVEN_74463-1 [Araneus ventricosus]